MEALPALLRLVLASAVFGCSESFHMPLPTVGRKVLSGMGKAVATVVDATSEPECLPLLLTDGATSYSIVSKDLHHLGASGGVGMFEVTAGGQEANVTLAQLSQVVSQARRLRQLSWCVTVVVVSDDPAFLAAFAQWSLKGRLLVWSTRLLVVTRLPPHHLRDLLASYWTFSMMNTMMINIDDASLRCSVYVRLPYSPQGAQVVQIASWTFIRGLMLVSSYSLFPEKFTNFYGSSVNVTALPYAPYWMTSGEGDNTTHSGIDYILLETLAEALNFTFHVLPSANWDDVTDQVQDRTSFMASIVYVVLPERLEKYDYTVTFDYSPLCFAMAKPTLKPQWQSLYHPLADEVWAAILATVFIMCVLQLTLTRAGVWREGGSRVAAGAVVQEVVGTLLGQGFTGRLSTSRSNRVLVAAWLVFAFIVGTAYRGNLTASLTLPKYPPRPETVEDLVNTVDRATMESYGTSYKRFFTQSKSSVFRALGKLIFVGVGIVDGLQETLTRNQALLAGRQYVELMIAKHFTQIDGSSQHYIAREMITPAASAWPVPHDAPYKTTLDRSLMAVTEAGLYEQWRKKLLNEAQRISRARQREILKQQREELEGAAEEADLGSSSSSNIKALTIVHMQGPLMVLLLGLVISGVTFIVETVRETLSANTVETPNL